GEIPDQRFAGQGILRPRRPATAGGRLRTRFKNGDRTPKTRVLSPFLKRAVRTPAMPMDHATPDILLQFLRQELEAEQARAVAAHVSSCPDCERRLAELAGGLPWPLDPVARLVGDPTLVGRWDSAGADEPRPSTAPLAQVPGYEVLGEVGRGGM